MKTLVGSSVLLVAAVGCSSEYSYVEPSAVPVGQLAVANGAIQGEFGSRGRVSGEASVLDAQDYGDTNAAMIYLGRNESDVGAAMVILSVNGAALENLAVGDHTFSYSEFGSDVSILANTCSGAARDLPASSGVEMAEAMDYDQPADSGVVTVSELPNGLRQVVVRTETLPVDPNTNQPMGESVHVAEASFQFQPRFAR
jgi:hypothetical protein